MIYIYLYNAIQVVVFSFVIQWCCHYLQVFHTGDLWWARQSNVVGHIANQIFNAEATLTYFDNAGGHVHRWLLTMENNAGSSPLRSQIISWKGLKLSLNPSNSRHVVLQKAKVAMGFWPGRYKRWKGMILDPTVAAWKLSVYESALTKPQSLIFFHAMLHAAIAIACPSVYCAPSVSSLEA